MSKEGPERAVSPALGGERPNEESGERYRRLPTGLHGLERGVVQRDQRARLLTAMTELTARHGYQAVRIGDLTTLARVSRPTFYSLYKNKEQLFLSAYDEIASRTAHSVMKAYDVEGSERARLHSGIRAFAELAAAEPDAMSLLVLGAFGAGPKALERRNRTLEALEGHIRAMRDRASTQRRAGLTVKVVLGGIREVTAARLREGRASVLPELAGELSAWAGSYPLELPVGLPGPVPPRRRRSSDPVNLPSERARGAEGRLPSGRHHLPRQLIVKSQRERIVDATAAIVAAKGLAGLTIPEIARRASISNETFYEMYPTKHDAFLGAQKVGMHQALRVTAEAYDAHENDWPRAVASALRALIDYLSSEPAHAHLSLVDTFAASPQALEIRDSALHAFTARLGAGHGLAGGGGASPAIAAEATAGGIWQILHHYTENDRVAELPDAAPQIIYMALTPFLGPKRAAAAARGPA
jgi:AcrR family transcriptional regulator